MKIRIAKKDNITVTKYEKTQNGEIVVHRFRSFSKYIRFKYNSKYTKTVKKIESARRFVFRIRKKNYHWWNLYPLKIGDHDGDLPF